MQKVSELQLLSCAFVLTPFLFHPLLSLSFLLSGNCVCQLAAGHNCFVLKILLVFLTKNLEVSLKKKKSCFKLSNTASFLFFLVLSCQTCCFAICRGRVIFSLVIPHEFQLDVVVLTRTQEHQVHHQGLGWRTGRPVLAYPNPGSLALRQTLSQWQSKLCVGLLLGDRLHGLCLKTKPPQPHLPPQSLHTATHHCCFTCAESSRSEHIKTFWHSLLQRLS